MADVGIECTISIGVDAAAAIGVVRRRGVGRVRPFDVRYLWIQERISSGEFRIYKVLGTNSPENVMTKFLGSDQMCEGLARMGIWFMDGRARTAPTVSLIGIESRGMAKTKSHKAL